MLFNGFELIYVIYLAILNTTYGMDGAHTEHRSKMLFDAFGLILCASDDTGRPSCIIRNWPVGAECGLLFLGVGEVQD